MLYELSLTGAYVASTDPEPETKRHKTEDMKTGTCTPEMTLRVADFDAMREKMAEYDAKREDVIKRTRDVQKISKQAIFSAHRNAMDNCDKQLADAARLAQGIFTDLIEVTPALRYGSFSNALEEFAEAVLYRVWLRDGTLLPLSGADFMGLVNSVEYLGGLVDFTGEVGRYAVAAASKRDDVTVRKSLAAVLAVQDALMRVGLPAKLSKKADELKSNVKKLEHVLYELSLVKATGRSVTASTTDMGSGGAADEE